ncbi:MAG TPA: hypothetical protein VHE08_03950 [Solirubrobacterales bacterium]|nr:hypothetical protein [Solirubrobacterales bacterium]
MEMMVVGAALLLPAAAMAEGVSTATGPAARHSLPFRPGRYSGFTNQKCPTEPVPAGACKPGRRLPVSFTLSNKSISNLKAIVVTSCLGQPPSVVHVVSLPVKRPLVLEGTWAFLPDNQLLDKGWEGNDDLTGSVRDQTATGRLFSLLFTNPAGRPDATGHNWCSANVKWQARRQ